METQFAGEKISGNRVLHGGNTDLIVSFYMEAEYQTGESETQGRPIYKDVPYIWIRFPGDKTRERKRRAKPADKHEWPRQWAAFESQTEEVHEGTPIEEWGPVSRSLALNLKGMNIFTVENLAAVPDASLHNLGHGARTLRDKAQSWLKATEGSAEVMALRKQNEDLKADLELMKQQIAELGEKKRGRPKKSD